MDENNPENLDAAPSVDLVPAATRADVCAPSLTLAKTVLDAQRSIADGQETVRSAGLDAQRSIADWHEIVGSAVPIARSCVESLESYVAPLKQAQASINRLNTLAGQGARIDHSARPSWMVQANIGPKYPAVSAHLDIAGGSLARSALSSAADLATSHLGSAAAGLGAFRHQTSIADSLSAHNSLGGLGKSLVSADLFASVRHVDPFTNFRRVDPFKQHAAALGAVRVQMQSWLGGIGEAARWGSTVAKTLARLPLMAALQARDAALRGDTDDVDGFIRGTLKMRLTKQTYWLREAVVAVLLENDWLPDDVGVSGPYARPVRPASLPRGRLHGFG